jgi:two-component system, NarL family, nitrate/nitrite response regulator NarL
MVNLLTIDTHRSRDLGCFKKSRARPPVSCIVEVARWGLHSGDGPSTRHRFADSARTDVGEVQVRDRLFLVVGLGAYAELLRERIAATSDFVVVGSATDGSTGLRQIRRHDHPPEIVLLDASAPSGYEFARALRQRYPHVGLVVVGAEEDPSEALAWAQLGVTGLLGRAVPTDELLESLTRVARGEALCSAGIASALLRAVAVLTEPSPGEGSSTRLTTREQEVAVLLDEGCSNREIAERMHIEAGTVKSHVHNVMRKLGVSRRAQVAARMRKESASSIWPPRAGHRGLPWNVPDSRYRPSGLHPLTGQALDGLPHR